MKKLNYTEDLLRVIFFWIGIFFLVSGVLSFLGILKPAVNSGIQNPDMLGTVFSIVPCVLMIPILVGIAYVIPKYQFEKMSRESVVERIRKE